MAVAIALVSDVLAKETMLWQFNRHVDTAVIEGANQNMFGPSN